VTGRAGKRPEGVSQQLDEPEKVDRHQACSHRQQRSRNPQCHLQRKAAKLSLHSYAYFSIDAMLVLIAFRGGGGERGGGEPRPQPDPFLSQEIEEERVFTLSF
jgi:hypothetical protein